MTKTNEFSIILLPDNPVAEDIGRIRKLLPASPYRQDDRPHLTLLRGVTTPSEMDDAVLLDSLRPLLRDFMDIQVNISVDETGSYSNHLYDATAVIKPNIPDELRHYRRDLVTELERKGYSIEEKEKQEYKPHLTIRLGVELNHEAKQVADRLFPAGRMIKIVDWSIYRLLLDGDTRHMHEVQP